MEQRRSFPVVGLHIVKPPPRCRHSSIEGANRARCCITAELLQLCSADAEGIRKGLTHQPLEQPTLIHPIPGTLDRGTAIGKIQRTARTKKPIQNPGKAEAGIEQHRSPQGNASPQQRTITGQLTGTGNHRQEVTVAAGRIGATGKFTTRIRSPQIETQHGKSSRLQTKPHPP